MMHSDGGATVTTKSGRPVQVEPLEGRVLLNGSSGPGGGGGGGDDGDRFHITNTQLTAIADFNGDGKADLATVNRIGVGKHFTISPLIVQLGKGDGRFNVSSFKLNVGDASAVLAGDFNGDKEQDIAIVSVNNSGQTQVSLLIGDGKGKFLPAVQRTVGVMPTDNIVAGDINGDGFADLLSFNNNNLWESLNDGTGKLLPAVQMDNPFGTAANPVAAGDIDNDGRIDLIGVSGDQIFANKAVASTGEFILTFLPTFATSLPLSGKRLVIADVNGDGKNDFLALGDGSV